MDRLQSVLILQLGMEVRPLPPKKLEAVDPFFMPLNLMVWYLIRYADYVGEFSTCF